MAQGNSNLQNVVGLFPSRQAAEGAQTQLSQAGISGDAVSGIHDDHPQLDRVLQGAGMQQHETQLYRNGLQQGESLVIARVGSDADVEHVGDVFERHQPVDIDQRLQHLVDQGVITLPVIEEQLRVGKRVIERGGVRVFVHVETIPVEIPVSLREETVHVERRPANRAASDTEAQRTDESYEVHSRHEEAVVKKQAVVKEEIVISKGAREHTETIQDTVRRTDVDVQQIPAQTTATTRIDADLDDTTTDGTTKRRT